MNENHSTDKPPRDEVAALVASTVFHVVVLLVLSVLFLQAGMTEARIDTTLGFASQPEDATTTIDANAPLSPVEHLPPAADPLASSAVDFVPNTIDAVITAAVPGSQQAVADGVSAVVAGIHERVRQAGGQGGEVQFSLAWHDRNDIDLHVIVPRGERIYHGHRKSVCGGDLAVDMNVRPRIDEPVENIRWPRGKARSGRYTVLVRWYRQHVFASEVPFTLVARLGAETSVREDGLRHWGDLRVYRFIFIRPEVSAGRRQQLLKKYEELQVSDETKAGAMLAAATQRTPPDPEMLARIAVTFPHTDAAIKALQLLGGRGGKSP